MKGVLHMGLDPNIRGRYDAWLADPWIDEETKRELAAIAGDEAEIEDRFFRDLEFGTGGLRGVMGAGTNRVNRYTIARATQGLANDLLGSYGESGADPLSVAIAYDSRRNSRAFAEEAALVLAGNGIRAFLFESLRPTPELSFAVRHLGASAGIVITASHNPPVYNGYKVYGADGGQLVPADAGRVISAIRGVGGWQDIRRLTREEAEEAGLLRWLGEELDRRYIEAVTGLSFMRGDAALKRLRVVYTPLHGAGLKPVRMALEQIGVEQLRVVASQAEPDPEFSTVASPNPEEPAALAVAVAEAEEWGADLVIGTDPDADRMAAAVRHDGRFVQLSGNQCGALLLYYLLSRMKEAGKLPDNGAVVKTVVTGELGAAVARHFGMDVLNTLTGFKYIGEKMSEFERTGSRTFVFGYEESCGFLAGNYARDKDGVLAAMLVCEAAAWYKARGQSLVQVLERLYGQFGYFAESLESKVFPGRSGMERMAAIMDTWRRQPPERLGGFRVARAVDYAVGVDGLPKENAIRFLLEEEGSWVCIRPSGTEPKIKVYVSARGDHAEQAADRLKKLKAAVAERMEQ